MVLRGLLSKRVTCQTCLLRAFQRPIFPLYRGFHSSQKKSNILTCSKKENVRWSSFETPSSPADNDAGLIHFHKIAALLSACPGCGALAQVLEPGQPGYYSTKRRALQSYIESWSEVSDSASGEVEIPETGSTLDAADHAGGLSDTSGRQATRRTPLCDRCHDLVHHHTGLSIIHPSLQSLGDTIAESPYRYNHIYHVLDAADFPMSLIHNVHSALGAAFQRSKNRRARHAGFRGGRKIELSFIITRSDLLAPKKEQIDKLMQYFISVLRDALGRAGQNVRLGNVHCVSAKRGWWTREIKAAIWKRGGAGWMVGKVNVGKSNLFEVVFPKGNSDGDDAVNLDALRNEARVAGISPVEHRRQDPSLDKTVPSVLLPPARQETQYPTMPTISTLPGTTASPIRIPFGNGRGELIDLPGLARCDLDDFVLPEFREDIIMKSRITPVQQVIKPGKSLLLGGLVRITSLESDLVVLAYPFVNIKPHLTSTEKAIVLEKDGKSQDSGIPYIVQAEVGQTMASAGQFELKWDVTRQRAGPLTSRSAIGFKSAQLPFVVLAADILIESVGWVEVVAQVRKKQGLDEPLQTPKVEVFSPHGKFIGVRQPMNAWTMGGLSTRPSVKHRKKRPRKSMASVQRQPQTS